MRRVLRTLANSRAQERGGETLRALPWTNNRRDEEAEINDKHDFRVDVGRTARSSAVGITSDSYGCGPDTRCDRLL